MKRAIGMLMTARSFSINSISLISNTSAASPDTLNVTTPAIDTSGSDFLVIVASYYAVNGITGVSDSKLNTWTPLTAQGGNGRVLIFYCENPIVGSGHTFSILSVVPTYPSIAVGAFKNVKLSSAFDQENGSASSGMTIQTGSVTPSLGNELLIAGLSFDTAANISIDSSFIITDTVNFSAGVNFGVSMAYKVQTGASSENPTFTRDSSGGNAAAIATFKHN